MSGSHSNLEVLFGVRNRLNLVVADEVCIATPTTGLASYAHPSTRRNLCVIIKVNHLLVVIQITALVRQLYHEIATIMFSSHQVHTDMCPTNV